MESIAWPWDADLSEPLIEFGRLSQLLTECAADARLLPVGDDPAVVRVVSLSEATRSAESARQLRETARIEVDRLRPVVDRLRALEARLAVNEAAVLDARLGVDELPPAPPLRLDGSGDSVDAGSDPPLLPKITTSIWRDTRPQRALYAAQRVWSFCPRCCRCCF